MAKTEPNPADYIQPLYINGLNGRMLHLPAKRTGQREILLLYGSHSSLERMFAVAQEMNRYGAVTLPDWPGFGGMDSLFKIGHKPTLDDMADYLAAFVTMRYRRRRVTIIGMSYGFAVATRMLQRYPHLADKVELVVSIVGFAHYTDFHVPRRNFLIMKYGSTLFRAWLPTQLAKLFIKGPLIRATYTMVSGRHSKMKDATLLERRDRINFEIILWKINDLRTYFYTASTMFSINLCTEQPIAVPCYHVAIAGDQFFDNHLVEQHLKVAYTDVTVVKAKLTAHMPTVIAKASEVAPFFPPKLRRVLAGKE